MSGFWRVAVPLMILLVMLASGPALGQAAQAAKSKFNKVLTVGNAAPDWKDLPGIDGKNHSLADFKEAKTLVIVFACNHCPMTKLYEERLLAFSRKYAAKKVQVVAINASRGEAESLEKMTERARESEFPFPYLRDEPQKCARSYGATVTPHVFVLDAERKIAYMGAIDDQLNAAKVEKSYLIDAVDALLDGKTPRIKESLQRGCPIEYE